MGARLRRAALLGATMLSGMIAVEAHAQTAPAADDAVDAIVVTGYRKSLAQSTVAKRETTGFADAIFAEDIGKFPDSNIAESFNRVPGITITRDITGEGVNVAIRGLGSNFTNVTLNGASIAVASSGATDAQGTDRSVDLSFFPTDLFTKLTVNKSYSASLLEGGAAGNIDMRSARPFDRPGQHVSMNVQGVKADGAKLAAAFHEACNLYSVNDGKLSIVGRDPLIAALTSKPSARARSCCAFMTSRKPGRR